MLFWYSHMANYAWMLNEALFIHYQITARVMNDSMRLSIFLMIGWLAPLLFLLPLAYMTTYTSNKKTDQIQGDALSGQISLTEYVDQMGVWNCLGYQNNRWVRTFAMIPICVALVINLLVLVHIIGTVIKKLRVHRTRNRVALKALKATMMLLPLLGLSQIFVIYNPCDQELNICDALHLSITTLLRGTQGFLVAFFYCFRNSEVIFNVKREITSLQTNFRIKNRFNNAIKFIWPSSNDDIIARYSSSGSRAHYEQDCHLTDITILESFSNHSRLNGSKSNLRKYSGSSSMQGLSNFINNARSVLTRRSTLDDSTVGTSNFNFTFRKQRSNTSVFRDSMVSSTRLLGSLGACNGQIRKSCSIPKNMDSIKTVSTGLDIKSLSARDSGHKSHCSSLNRKYNNRSSDPIRKPAIMKLDHENINLKVSSQKIHNTSSNDEASGNNLIASSSVTTVKKRCRSNSAEFETERDCTENGLINKARCTSVSSDNLLTDAKNDQPNQTFNAIRPLDYNFSQLTSDLSSRNSQDWSLRSSHDDFLNSGSSSTMGKYERKIKSPRKYVNNLSSKPPVIKNRESHHQNVKKSQNCKL